MINSRHRGWRSGVDWIAILIYVLLVGMGLLNIYAAVYNGAEGGLFNLNTRYGMQVVWIGVSFFVAVAILLIDGKYYHIFSYPFYGMAIMVLLAVLFVGKEVNGAKAWIVIGPVALQPTELVKFTTALAVARYMSRYDFSIRRFRDIFVVGLIVGLPIVIILLQNDTGSALAYGAFLITLYREGFNRWFYIAMIMLLLLFILSFLLTPDTLLILLILVCVAGEGVVNGYWRMKLIYLAAIALAAILIYFGVNLLMGVAMPLYLSILIPALGSLVFAAIYAYRRRLRNVWSFIGLFLCSLAFSFAVDYLFDNVMQPHQRERILSLLGLEDNPHGSGYNVNQSKIAIGSGGFFGKGFLNGTQTKYNFVPEQSTDFIFCTVGEEWGFMGSATVLILFCLLILRLIQIGERQGEAFGRIYCYSAAAIFFTHVMINVGMTVGLMPVIGIPLPFFSYGGSSLLAFTILFFVAVRLDLTRRETSNKPLKQRL